MQSSELCPNTKSAQKYSFVSRGAANRLRSYMASGNSWFDTCPGLCIKHTFEFELLRHRLALKGREIEMSFLFSLHCLAFLLAG